MTNFEYILKNISERDLASVVTDETRTCFLLKSYNAFDNWRENLAGVGGNMYYVDDSEHQPNVFATPTLHFYEGVRPKNYNHSHNKKIGEVRECSEYNKYAMPRTETLSMEIWLTKQYNPKEWTDEEN